MSSGELARSDQPAGRLASAVRNGPLGVANFRLLSVGQLTSTVGDYCYAVALPWLVLSTHGGTLLLGTVLACYGVPRTVLIPLGGVLADKLSSRTVMLGADVVRCLLVGALTFLAARHINALAALAPIAAVLGAGEGVFLPASLSVMPTLLPAEQLPAANAVATALIQLGSLAGPVLGGLLVATAGSAPAFAVDAASFAVSAIALAYIRTRRPAVSQQAQPAETAPAETAPAEAAGQSDSPGLRQLVRQSTFFQLLLVIIVVANFATSGTFEVAMPALAHASYGASGYGVLLACFAVGTLGGTLVAARMSSFRKPAVAALSTYVIAAIGISLMPYLGGLPGAAAALAIAGIGNGFGNTVMITLVQQWAPPPLLGRIMSIVMLAGFGTFPISVALAGVLVRHLHAAPFFPIAGITLGAVILLALTQASIRNFGAQAAVPER